MQFQRILIVGYGTMAGAMVEGWLAAGYAKNRFVAYHPTRKQAAHGLNVVNMWPEQRFDAVLLGVKPQKLGDVAGELAVFLTEQTTLISLLAGIDLASLSARFPDAGGIVRFMPNLAAALGKSPNALIADGLDTERTEAVSTLARDLGTAEWIADEAQFDLVTALAGSGPGFVYRFIDALAQGAGALGLPADQAEKLAIAMTQGAAELAAQSGLPPGDLAARIASPGGMTQRGLDVLDGDDALNRLVTACLQAARDRGAQLAAEADDKG